MGHCCRFLAASFGSEARGGSRSPRIVRTSPLYRRSSFSPAHPRQRTFLMRLFLIAVVMQDCAGHGYLHGPHGRVLRRRRQHLRHLWAITARHLHGDIYHMEKLPGLYCLGRGRVGNACIWWPAFTRLLAGTCWRFSCQRLDRGGNRPSLFTTRAKSLFSNIRVSKLAALLITFFPSLVLWSSQALKDGLIILALALSILATLRLMEKITVMICNGFDWRRC